MYIMWLCNLLPAICRASAYVSNIPPLTEMELKPINFIIFKSVNEYPTLAKLQFNTTFKDCFRIIVNNFYSHSQSPKDVL